MWPPDQASSTLPLSSIPSPGASLAGGSATRPTPVFVFDALELAIHIRRPVGPDGRVHHSDRGGQYVSIKYTARPTKAGIEPSVGSVGDGYDNALAETINGFIRPSSSTGGARGAPSGMLNTPRWNGSTGSITAACSNPSAISRRSKPRPNTTPNLNKPALPHKTQTKWPPRKPGRFTLTFYQRCQLELPIPIFCAGDLFIFEGPNGIIVGLAATFDHGQHFCRLLDAFRI